MAVAISGSTGLIGGAVYQQLRAKTEIVRLGRRAQCDLQVDFARPDTVAALDLGGCDAVVHCAGIVDEDFKINPAAAYLQNTLGVSALAQRAAACGVRRFVYFSSSHVYGPLTGRVNEETPVNPLSDYAIAHYAAEQSLRRVALDRGLHALSLRPNAVFGIPVEMSTFDRWGLIPFSFPLEAVYQGRIKLFTSGQQRRNFISATDLARQVEQFLMGEAEHPAFEILNPVGPATISVYEFAQLCAEKYRELTGTECGVERPQPGAAARAAEFVFESSMPYLTPREDVGDYLITFMSRILGDLEHGKRYGA
jgi:UDP-glucose 4-epimerase